MTMGEYIRELRKSRHLSQAELGSIVGVNRAAVQKWEKGSVENIKRSTIKKLADFFGVSPAELMCWESPDECTLKYKKLFPDELYAIHNNEEEAEDDECILQYLNEEEFLLLANFRKLDEADQDTVTKMICFLLDNDKYKDKKDAENA